mmetsp:Transcript_2699/g.2976  ORF Transcript_2699/g.2976 Transcript_2699/m.2976 type:complete len:245 (-) Transcript_2699:336-1070(-)|eukprot:CAMPEP_0198264486 /NCGR_PEP_ID=MMETSP1447-20131203/16124_1 /TAXON_ID=420782 /ORGANISM="Chaetoceros dichaeta, Strain CCMP1751" /LENGTH=244 /DNA_ID=CAMNT_0043953445 /DNA_START=90 /DNA_END=824 /DNA_ORIENTATION=+
MTKLSLLTVVALAPILTTGFAPIASTGSTRTICDTPAFTSLTHGPLFAEGDDDKASEAVFKAPDEASGEMDAKAIGLELAEALGKGSAKKKRGKRKGSSATPTKTPTKAAATLTPEEVFYEGPPAITETLIPTISILTVIGIVPAAASWLRQLWVRYRITDRRIRVNSGVNGKDMAEIVYPDVVELRTVKRLLGDGDMVLFLRDGAKFEMRNIPNFEETMVFICAQLDADVVKTYKEMGDVTKP